MHCRRSVERSDQALGVLMTLAGLSAVGGGTMLVFELGPSSAAAPLSLLNYTPFTTFLVPGLLLALVIGGSNLLAAALLFKRSAQSGAATPFATDAALLAGGALTLWIFAEAAMFRAVHGLHIACGALGLVILHLAVRRATRSPTARHRYVLLVGAAEALGFMAPALVGIATARAGWSALPQAAAVSAAGLIEGALLGLGQGVALSRVGVRPLPFALLTAAGAGLVWSAALSTRLWMTLEVAIWAKLVAGVLLGIVGLVAMGSLQWIELRKHVRGARTWLAWTALAWLLALPWSFAAGPFVDASTPFLCHVVLWGSGGALMAYVLALVSWQGARRLRPAGEPLRSSSPRRLTPAAPQSGNLRPVFLK